MPTMCLWMPRRFYGVAALVAVAVLQCACGNSTVAQGPAAEKAPPVQAGFFSVAADQMAHLKVVTVGTRVWQTTVVTTGTVDWDADHTTQAITQVNGPISRILVDTGAKVKAGDPLLYVSSPDVANAISAYRKARNREVFNKRIVDRMNEPAGPRRRRRKGFREQRGRLQRRPHRRAEQPAGPPHLRHHQPGDRPGREAGHRHQHRTGRALAHRRRGGAEDWCRPACWFRPAQPLLPDQRRLHGLGAGPHLRSRSASWSRVGDRGGGDQPCLRPHLSRHA